MTPFIFMIAFVVLSVLSPFLGEDTRRGETVRRRGSFLL
jgi:hypothetical protein